MWLVSKCISHDTFKNKEVGMINIELKSLTKVFIITFCMASFISSYANDPNYTTCTAPSGGVTYWTCPTTYTDDSNDTYVTWSIGGGNTHRYYQRCYDGTYYFPPESYKIECTSTDVDVSYNAETRYDNELTVTNWATSTRHIYIKEMICDFTSNGQSTVSNEGDTTTVYHSGCSSASDFTEWDYSV